MEQSEIKVNVVDASTKIAEDILEYLNVFYLETYDEKMSLELYDVIYNKLKELEIKE